MNWNPSQVEDKIGIHFKHGQTLRLALIHPSYAKQIQEPEIDNQRLEFLGERILNLAIVDYLYHHFTHFSPNKLRALRDKLLESERLTKLWYDLQLGDTYPFLGLKEERHRLRLKAQNPFEKAFKALVGAIYTDRGFSQTRNWLHKYLITPLLERYLTDTLEPLPSIQHRELLGNVLLKAIVADYLNRQILYVNPSKLKPLWTKLVTKDNQAKYLTQLTTEDWEKIEVSPEELKQLKKSFKALLATIYLECDRDNSKTSFRKTSKYFAEHFLDEDTIWQQAIALLLKDGKSQKWIIHNVMGYPSKNYNQGRERFYELMGKPE